jgi:hypothetical protein
MTDLIDAPPATPAAGVEAAPRPSTTRAPMAPRGASGERSGGRPWPGWRALLRPAGAFVVSRIAMCAAAFVFAAVRPGLRVLPAMGSVFDGRWYLQIAQSGYPHHLVNEGDGSRWAFFPALPAAIRAVATVTRLGLPDAAVLVAFFFGLTSAVAIWLAVREVCGSRLADRAVLLYVFCPTAFVLSLAYTEGLFLTAAALCLYALTRRQYMTAAVCACAAGLTRNTGIVVIATVVLTAGIAAWRERSWRPALAAVVAPLGLVSFMLYSWTMIGTPVAFMASEKFWHGQHFVWFATPLVGLLQAVRLGPGAPAFVPDAMAGLALVAGVVGIWLLDKMSTKAATPSTPDASGESGGYRIPVAWWLYTVSAVLVGYSAYFPNSIPRYTMAAFPLFAAFAWKLPRRFDVPVVVVMAVFQGALLLGVLDITVHPVAVPLVP